jgi:hypothetical protein
VFEADLKGAEGKLKERSRGGSARPERGRAPGASGARFEAFAEARTPEILKPASPAGIRMRRTREWRREGRMSIRCDISAAQIEALVEAGLIDPVMRGDVAEITRGLGAHLAAWQKASRQ